MKVVDLIEKLENFQCVQKSLVQSTEMSMMNTM